MTHHWSLIVKWRNSNDNNVFYDYLRMIIVYSNCTELMSYDKDVCKLLGKTYENIFIMNFNL